MSIYRVAGIPYSSELYHHGLKGMRWGRRRFQNVDGSLTPAGRERYGVGTFNEFYGNHGNKRKSSLFEGLNKAALNYERVSNIAKAHGVDKGIDKATDYAIRLKNGSSQKKTVTNKQSSESRSNKDNEKIEKRKRIAKAAAVAVGAGLAAYGAYKIHKISKDSKEYLRGLEAIRNNGSMSMSWTKAGHDSQAASKLLTNYANSSKLGKIKQVYGKHDLSWYTRFANPVDTLSVDSALRERLRQSR